MAKKPEEQASAAQANPPVKLADLQTAQVQVVDAEGNLFYLEPGRKQGDYVLRVLPKPAPVE